MTDGGERKNARARADGRATRDDNVAYEFDTVAQFDTGFDNAEWADLDTVSQSRVRRDNRGGMNCRAGHQDFEATNAWASAVSASMALISASATTAPSTFASP
jgi:hypothetical protein